MREIKFIGWNKQSNIMVDNIQVFSPKDTFSLNDAFDKDMVVLPLQYVGLKDKNGKEIYEGDYVVSDHYLFGELEQGVVEYTHTGQYVLAQGSFKSSIHDLVFNSWKLEVIGNIYENKELIEESK